MAADLRIYLESNRLEALFHARANEGALRSYDLLGGRGSGEARRRQGPAQLPRPVGQS